MAGIPAQVARTGYTGEDGFEVFVETGRVGELWDALLGGGPGGRWAAGRPRRPRHAAPRGRDAALRQRARSATTPFDAGLGRVVKLDKTGRLRRARGARAGRRRWPEEAPRRADRRGPRHRPPRLPGPRRRTPDRRRHQRHAVADARRADRDGLRRAGRRRGRAPMLDVEIRDARVPARVVPLPFYRRTT